MKVSFPGVTVHSFAEKVKRAADAVRLSYNSESSGPEADLRLLATLVQRGPSHSKFMRLLTLEADITAPRFFWSEFDTYKVGTTALSESTMHTLGKRLITQDDFEYAIPDDWLALLNIARGYQVEVMKNLLPEGFLQRRIVGLNYQVLRTMYSDRRNHRLPQWRMFCKEVEGLPYSSLIMAGMPCVELL